jgi:hypothetical protein
VYLLFFFKTVIFFPSSVTISFSKYTPLYGVNFVVYPIFSFHRHISRISVRMSVLTIFFCVSFFIGEHAVGSWLRRFATSRRVAGSIPDDFIGFFN